MKILPTLSVIIITRNEEADIRACLESVKELSADIVVVDSGSTDQTLAIAKEFTDRIYSNAWNGYGPQKQYALDKAKGPWVLNIDADERVSPALAEEIRAMLNDNPQANGFDIPFRNYFLGKALHFGSGRCESHVRLFKKEKASYGDKKIHEGIRVTPPIRKLKNVITHHSYKTIDEYKNKREEYTTLIAQEKFDHGERFHFWHHLRWPYEFLVRYVLKLGFLDGQNGFRYAVLSSTYVWMKFAKLKQWEKTK